ncbi:MAG: NAD(P)H-dependent oxidoreductase [bacterium]
MKAALINGSPRVGINHEDVSASQTLLTMSKRYLRKNHVHDYEELHIKTGELTSNVLETLMACDLWILAFPIYCGGIPAHLLRFLQAIEEAVQKSGSPDILVAAMATGNLYEGENCGPALSMMENWARALGLRFTAGLGVGGGPVLALHGPYAGFRHWRSLGRAMTQFAESASGYEPPHMIFCSPNMRRRTMLIRLSRILKRKWHAL